MTTRKKIVSTLIILSLAILLALYFYQNKNTEKPIQKDIEVQQANNKTNNAEQASYETLIEPFISLTSDTFEEVIQSDKLNIVYMGRETCPHCQAFVPKLNQVYQNNPDFTIYYINTDDSHDLMIAFAQSNNISTVPQLITVQQGKVIRSLDIQPETSTDDISDFLKTSL